MTTVNVMNFVRATEHRVVIDLFDALKKELECLKKHDIKSTVLLQYDALISPEYQELINEYKDYLDVGIWLEVVRQLTDKAGVKYNGREGWNWDHHSNATFTLGYELEDRKKIIDVAMNDFKKYFGNYPKIVASWAIDTYSLNYMVEKYGIIGSANCPDQMGIDGYTLWGGYLAGSYYPSKKNVYCPAQNKENQINIPVYRLIGTDYVHFYSDKNCFCLEPAANGTGDNPELLQWFTEQMTEGECLDGGYFRAGQENSFGWPRLGKGFEAQMELYAKLRAEGKIQIETMSETSQRLNSQNQLTHPTARSFLKDWSKDGKQGIWYMSKDYRASVVAEEDSIKIRDIFLFDENFEDAYLTKVEKTRSCFFTNLEVFSGLERQNGEKAFIYISVGDKNTGKIVSSKKDENGNLAIESENGLKIVFAEDKFTLSAKEQIKLSFLFRDPPKFAMPDDNEGIDYDATRRLFNPPTYKIQDGKLLFTIDRNTGKYEYPVNIIGGDIRMCDGVLTVTSNGENLVFDFSQKGKYLK